MDGLIRDGWNAWRLMRTNWSWTLVAVMSLAVGIGATAVVFSIVESVLFRPFPYADPARIVLLQGFRGTESAADLADLREHATTLDSLALYSGVRMRALDSDPPVAVAEVGRDVFRVLGVNPVMGTGFPPTPDLFFPRGGDIFAALRAQPERVVLLGHSHWQGRYGGDRTVVGHTLRLDGVPHEIVGVMPRGFFFPEPGVELWTPLGPPNVGGYTGVARLAAGVPLARARSEIELISRRLDDEHPRFPSASGDPDVRAVEVTPIRNAAISEYQLVLWLLLGAVTLVLLIACANVANLLLARGVARGKELAVRATLGASRMALVRQLMVESVLLSVMGGLAGVGLAMGGLRVVLGLGLVEIPRLDAAAMNAPVLLFAAATAILTGLLAGVGPALGASQVNLMRSLKAGGNSSSQSGNRHVREWLVIAEVSLAVVLLVGSGLLVRSAVAMSRIEWGFRADSGLWVVAVAPRFDTRERLQAGAQASPEWRLQLSEQVLGRLRALPTVVAAGAGSRVPLVRRTVPLGERVVADGAPLRSAVTATRTIVTPGYLTALGVDIRGREFDDRDHGFAPRTVVLSESLARSLFADGDPIGRSVHFATLRSSAGIDFNPPMMSTYLAHGGSENVEDFEITGTTVHTVIGVAADVRMADGFDHPGPMLYVDARQFRDHVSERHGAFLSIVLNGTDVAAFVIRTEGAPAAAIETTRAAIAAHDPTLSLREAAPMTALISRSLGGAGESGLILALATVFGGLSIMLAAVGIYGVISHAVSQRVHEIGVRMAIGARRQDIARMVVSHGLRLTGIGLGLGLAAAWACSRVLESRLFGVTPTDPVTYAAVAVFLLGLAAVASLIPARRAARVEPLVATRAE